MVAHGAAVIRCFPFLGEPVLGRPWGSVAQNAVSDDLFLPAGAAGTLVRAVAAGGFAAESVGDVPVDLLRYVFSH